MGGVLLRSLSNTSFFLQINSWLNWCWGRSRSEGPAVGPDSISSTLRDQIGIKSRHLRDPLVVASFTASSRDLRGRKFWESCKFRKFPRSTLAQSRESSDLWRHHIHTVWASSMSPKCFHTFWPCVLAHEQWIDWKSGSTEACNQWSGSL